jgi:4-methylaminobutanoate oxidase (formaldehyde-forming)
MTSGMFAHTLGAAAGLGYVADEGGVTDELIASGRFEILVGNRSVPARASLRPLYDPAGARPRS